MSVANGRPDPLGCTIDENGANFSIFSSVADRVELCLFDDAGHEDRITLPGRSGDIWHGYVPGVATGQRYGYRVHGPWDPARGMFCCGDKLLMDPYARAIDGIVRWNEALFPYNPSHPYRPANRTDTARYTPRSVVADTAFDWTHDHPLRTPLADTVIYEVHVKGFTHRHPDVPPDLRGTYAGFAHPASVEHFRRLGITAVELLPIQTFIHRRHLVARGLRNFWGYDPIGYFAPHAAYAHARDPVAAVVEFKKMVRALHAGGIEVIIDVVFNHTGEGGEDGPVLAFRGIDNEAYYRLDDRQRSRYVDYTGTQNTVNAEHPQVRCLIMDSLRYWADVMHVDGFRFDLATALVREGDGVNMNSSFFEALRSDPSLGRLKLIAEPWDLGPEGYRLGKFPGDWLEWNDRYRDDVRDYWNGRGASNAFVRRVSGSGDLFGADRGPQRSVNYVTCHDGFTLADLTSYENKRNVDNSEDNRDGPQDEHAWNCGAEGETEDAGVNALRLRQRRNFLATLLLSRGVPMLLAGDELGRTQRGNNNAYCQDNELSWLDWENADEDLITFVSALVRQRQRSKALHGPHGEDSARWFDARGEEIAVEALPDEPPVPLQAWIGETAERSVLILCNPTDQDCAFTVPASAGDRRGTVMFDTAGDPADRSVQRECTVPAHTLRAVEYTLASHGVGSAGLERRE